MTAACCVDIRISPVLIQVIFGNRKSRSRIEQNGELATKLDKLLNKTTCEVHVGGEHPSGAKNLDINTSLTEHTAEHHITRVTCH